MMKLTPTPVRFRTIALPTSHGGWGFLLEPLLLGLGVAPSGAGLWLSLAVVAAFLTQQPLKLALSDRWRGRRYPRTVWAERFAFGYSLIALLTFGLAWWTAAYSFWLPLLLAAPLAITQLVYDAKNQGRSLIAELCGALALGTTASALALAAGWSLPAALGLWLILGCRTAPSIIYVRAKLRFERRQPIIKWPVWMSHSLGVMLVAVVAYFNIVPWLAVAPLLILLLRTVIGLRPHPRPVEARTVGFQEMGYGLLTVVLAALGYMF